MQYILKKLRSDNKGNTLAIVLIGMLVVGVLGTVILKASSVNMDMKISNLKGKQNFYYVERAIDEIYAGIGEDVSRAIKESYDNEIQQVIKKTSNYEINLSMSADFKNGYKTRLNTYNTIDNAVSRMENIINASSAFYAGIGVTISVAKTPTSSVDFCVTDPEKIIIKDVVVKSITNKKYESSVKTNFVIEVPDITFSFDDASDTDLNELFKYAIIANGGISDKKDILDNENGAVEVKLGTTTVNGNIYAGEYHDWADKNSGITWLDKEGICVSGNAKLVINGANVISKGAVNLDTGAEIEFNGEDSIPAAEKRIDTDLPLRLWANDILLTGNGAKADINGDCFIKDDLEVNGLEGAVDISGSYYGFGYKNISDTDMNEANSNETISLEAENILSGSYYRMEHEERSAVIVNGDRADVKLTTDGSKQLVLGGRAYIDLSGNSGQNRSADYMTGESISIKGNQKIYLLDNPALYQGESPTAVIKGNPMSINDLGLPGSYTLAQFYNLLKLDNNQVVAKKKNDTVYFYHKEENPDSQTQYVVDNVRNTTKDYWDKINEAVGNMEIQNLSLGAGTRSYTVGTAMQVVNGNLTTGRGGALPHMDNGISEAEFIDIVKDVRNRYGNIMYNLNDDRSKSVGSASSDITGGSTESPYDYFINKAMLESGAMAAAGRKSVTITPWGNPGNESAEVNNYPISGETVNKIKAQDLSNAGIDEKAAITIALWNNKNEGAGTTGLAISDIVTAGKGYGVIIYSGDVILDRDFEGMIICGGDVTVNNNHTFTANPKLMKLLHDKSSFLNKLIGGKTSTVIKPPVEGADIIKGGKGFAFDSFVKIEDWRKNED
ncbi:MAG: hypothetical protein K2I03_12905 [Lachnospiraceae bacterium]|nr:hypothetical protein [Lachnospiraceae bacterium]